MRRVLRSLIYILLASMVILGFIVYTREVEVRGEQVIATRRAMDTFVTITVIAEDTKKAEEAIEEAFREIKRIERLMCAYDEASEIFDLNKNGTSWVELSYETIYVLERARHYALLTGGAFDITVQPLVELWMERTKKTGKPPLPHELERVSDLVGHEGLVIDGTRARFTRSGMGVTLGGIAKGYAVDRASEILAERGIAYALVNIGGDIRAIGDRKGEPWRVGVQDPRHADRLITTINLSNASVATSGDYVRFFFLGKRRIHHLIDPRSGEPAVENMSVTIIADNSLTADALSTGIFVLGPEKGIRLLDSLGIPGFIITSDGRIIESEAWVMGDHARRAP